jgi:spoIIIJ-associated protein
METIEVTGRTVEEAIENAMDQLGVTREELKVTVIKEGKSGILGIGSEEAKILVEIMETQQPESEGSGLVKSTIEELLKLMGFNASVEPEDPLMPEETGTVPAVTFNITGDDDIGILIGRHGQTISSLQYLIRVMVSHKMEMPPQIIIDIDGYKKRRYESLQDTARRLAEQVKTRRVPFTLEPMPPFERRIIHITLANDPNVATQSIGEGESRKVVISPKMTSRPSRTIINR